MEARDLGDKEWNYYLNKYKDTYKIIIKGDGHRAIACKDGDISRYGLTDLVYYGEFKTIRQKTARLKLLLPCCDITQEGDYEFCCKFPESELPNVKNVFKIYKKRKLSQEHKEVLKQYSHNLKTSRSKVGV
jgi:hypothetical protein